MKRCTLLILLALSAVNLFAQSTEDTISKETRIAKESATTDGDRGLFTVASAETLNKKDYSFGFGWNNTPRTPHSLDINTGTVWMSYGVLSRLTVTAAFSPYTQVKATTGQPGYNYQYPYAALGTASGIGDTTLAAKYRIWRQPGNNIGGVALKGSVKFGTASPAKGLGTGATDVAADVLFTSVLPLKFLLDSSLGYTQTKNGTTPYAVLLKSQLRSGLGVAWPAKGLSVGNGTLQGIFEYSTLTFVGYPRQAVDPAPISVQDPSDLNGGIRLLFLDQGLSINAGYRNNIKFDKTFPGNKQAVGFVASLSYSKPVARSYGNNHTPTIALEANPPEIAVGGSSVITVTGFDADNDPLTYSWSAEKGQIVGSGEKVTFNAAGLPAGTYTVHASASDGKGGVGTAQIDIVVKP